MMAKIMEGAKPTILSVLHGSFPSDIRVEKVAKGLLAGGYDVKVLAKIVGEDQSLWKNKVLPIDSPNRSIRYIRSGWRRFLSWLNPAFFDSADDKKWIIKQALKINASVMIWNDLIGAHVGLDIARRLGIKFILDLHENYPYSMWSTERDRRISSRRYSLTHWFNYERWICERADLILTPGQEMNERLNGMHFVPHEKMLEFLNAEAPEEWDAQPEFSTAIDSYLDKDIVLYIGSASIHRGLDVIINAVTILKDDWPNLLFAIVGDGRAISQLKKQVKDNHLDGYVLFVPRRPFAEVASLIRKCKIGVVPHYRYGQTDNGAPHKLFQYMAFGKPVLVSNCASLKRIVTESEGGLIFQSGNAHSAAEQLLRLKDDKLRTRLGKKGRLAAEGPFHLHAQQVRLIKKVKELIGST